MPQKAQIEPGDYVDKTFSAYNAEQAASYAQHRSDPYTDRLYAIVLEHHLKSGGDMQTMLDVGCGTGEVTRSLGQHFDCAIGVDPSKEMIAQASKVGGQSKSGKPITFEVGRAECLNNLQSVGRAEVDLLVAGMAAHWFEMEHFWSTAAEVMKPGGTVALWTSSSMFCHPSTPNHVEVQRIMSKLEDDILGPYENPSIKLSRNMYDALPMPWSLNPPVEAFRPESHVRFEWNRNGKIEEGESDFFDACEEISLKQLSDNLGTASMVTQWRKANVDAARDGKDCVDITIRKIAVAMGFEEKDISEISIRVGNATSLLLLTSAKQK